MDLLNSKTIKKIADDVLMHMRPEIRPSVDFVKITLKQPLTIVEIGTEFGFNAYCL